MHRKQPAKPDPLRHRSYLAVTIAITYALLAYNVDVSAAQGGKAPWVGESLTGLLCSGGDARNFGPFDYNINKDKLPVVENYHFTPEVERLTRGATANHAMGDVNYTLIKFPNHHRALYSAVRFSLGKDSEKVKKRYPPAECFLQRAIRFSPKDSVPYMLYGLYMHRQGSFEQSLTLYRRAEELAPHDISLQYNIGLLLFETGSYAESYEYARKTYDAGMELPGLKRKLQQAGHWK